jgi:hypothetical protein
MEWLMIAQWKDAGFSHERFRSGLMRHCAVNDHRYLMAVRSISGSHTTQ